MRKIECGYSEFMDYIKSMNVVCYDDYSEGCLLDNFVVTIGNYIMFCYENFLNCYSSDMMVYVYSCDDKNIDDAWDKWYKLRDEFKDSEDEF